MVVSVTLLSLNETEKFAHLADHLLPNRQLFNVFFFASDLSTLVL